MSELRIYGASDDLIEVEGDIRDEFPYSDAEAGDLLAFSDGTILRIAYTTSGVWTISLVRRGRCEYDLRQAPEGVDDDYSDVALLRGDITWVVHATEWAARVHPEDAS